jgi:hypothetical protein
MNSPNPPSFYDWKLWEYTAADPRMLLQIALEERDRFADKTSDVTRPVTELPYAHGDECHGDLVLLLFPFFVETVDSK